MDFKFNFNIGDKTSPHKSSEVILNTADIQNDESKAKHSLAMQRYDAADIIKRWANKGSADIFAIDEVKIPGRGSSLYTVTPNDPDTNTKIKSNDLLSSVYEGGFKIWECTMDLVRYLQESDAGGGMKGKTVIDIGCGVGLLGVYALICCQAACVTFQDFNESVILDATGPTALINCQLKHDGKEQCHDLQDGEIKLFNILQNFASLDLAEIVQSKMNFIAGDWSELLKADANHSLYDVVLSSETIYNESNYDSLHDYLNAVTKSDGVVYMSAKSHYFGVGGGVCSWIEFVEYKGIFSVKLVKDIDANLKRHILRLVRK